jgi:hypothetical protein
VFSGLIVQNLFRILAVVLAVLWLPVTAHCELETIGALSHEVADDGCCEPVTDCVDDVCGLLEDGSFAPTLNLLKAPVPELSVDQCLACVMAQLAAEKSAPITPAWENADIPLNWIATRHFARRAAPPVRAPAILA